MKKRSLSWRFDTKAKIAGRIGFALAATGACALLFTPDATRLAPPTPSPDQPGIVAQARENYGKIPLSFEANHGQAGPSVDFLARGPGYAFALSPAQAVLALNHKPGNDDRAGVTTAPIVLAVNLAGGNPHATVAGERELEGKVNYLLGNDPSKWRTNIPTFGRVRYEEVYPGIDVAYYGNQERLEYDFIVAPGRDPSAIALEFAGATALEIEPATGDLLLATGEETVRQRAPVTYQMAGDTRRSVTSRYAMRDDGRVGFALGEYDRSAPLVIDPVLEYSTYFLGCADIAVDAAGNAYVTGGISTIALPTVNPFQSTNAGLGDVFVSKLDPAGTALVYSTYLGGTGNETGYGIAVDAAGSAYVTGRTSSLDFPLLNPIQGTRGGGTGNSLDAFVTKLSPAGNALVYSTYLGGAGNDEAFDIAVDGQGGAYISGFTQSTNFPVANALQPAFGGGRDDAFLSKINPAGSALVYSTYLGGSGPESTNLMSFDSGPGIYVAVDASGSACVAGRTYSFDFPIVNAVQGTRGDVSSTSSDAFVSKFNSTGTALVFSTYLGGNRDERGFGIGVDPAENVYVTGDTKSENFPTFNAFQSAAGGVGSSSGDVFVTKLTAAGAFIYSTYLGGTSNDVGYDIAADASGNAYLTGLTSSPNFPTVNPFQSGRVGGFSDAFFAKINAGGSALVYSSYLGGGGGGINNPSTSTGRGIALDPAGNAYVAGTTGSDCFPTTQGAFRTSSFGYSFSGFITKVSETGIQPPFNTTPCASSKLANISTRLRVETGNNVLIGGFIVTGTQPKRVIVRAIGPSLSSFFPGALIDPILELRDSSGALIRSNDNWRSDQETEIAATGIPPSNDSESAIVATLPANNSAYTAIVRGVDNGTGIGVVEAYDLDQTDSSKLANISTRGLVETGNNVLIAGTIVLGQTSQRVLVRAIGPSLPVEGKLANPILELRDGNGALIRANDNWRSDQEADIIATTIPPSDDLESALIETLPADGAAYTAIVKGVDGTTGVAVVEVYGLN